MSCQPGIQRAIGAAVLAAGLYATGAAGWRATRPPAAKPSVEFASPVFPARERRSALDTRELEEAANRNPFHPERRRPDMRYGEEAPRVEDESPPARPTPAVQLVGTVVRGEASFALLRRDGTAATWMRAGERVDGLELTGVARGTVTLSDGDSTIVLALPRAGRE